MSRLVFCVIFFTFFRRTTNKLFCHLFNLTSQLGQMQKTTILFSWIVISTHLKIKESARENWWIDASKVWNCSRSIDHRHQLPAATLNNNQCRLWNLGKVKKGIWQEDEGGRWGTIFWEFFENPSEYWLTFLPPINSHNVQLCHCFTSLHNFGGGLWSIFWNQDYYALTVGCMFN